jgi:putative radical SAM enzyme (TIGR03279 family)
MPPALAARVAAVAPGSPAYDAGILPGDELLTLNGEAVRDVIRYQIQADESRVELEIRRGGLEQLLVVEKAAGASLGLDLDTAVFDRVRTCDNHCPFCFIYQLPKGMRRSLYLKDDDYRLSFLYGNFTTLTRFTEADLERVITERLGPLYVSIHATDPDLRTRLLRNPRGATSLRWLGALLDAGIEVHGQVVVCPGINDGDALDDTLLGVLDRFPRLSTVGVVPLGVSDHTTEVEMRAHTVDEARRVLEIVGEWQARFTAVLGRRLVYASDEYHLLAGDPFPALDTYDELLQMENGIGMASAFRAEVHRALDDHHAGRLSDAAASCQPAEARTGFFDWVDGAPAEGYRAPRLPAGANASTPVTMGRAHDRSSDCSSDREVVSAPIVVLTGAMGASVLEPLLPALAEVAGVAVDAVVVDNQFFGGNIGVTGLLTGTDVTRALHALSDHTVGTRVLLPDVVLSNGKFLDDLTLDDLPRAVEVVPTDGTSLVRAVLPRAGSTHAERVDHPAGQPVSIGAPA